jgi:hypothetical protein
MGYLDHLTPTDLRTLAAAGLEAPDAEAGARLLKADPALVQQLLARPELFDQLFGAGSGQMFVAASPFLIFSVLVYRAAADLDRSMFVVERAGERARLPVFDVGPLRDFLADPARRLFLIELLASYTKLQSGVVWTRSERGWRRQRFSELDPVRYAALLDLVPESERPGIYRRLGDIALFLCGVFPDRAGQVLSGPVTLRRLQRLEGAVGLGATTASEETGSPIELLERLGQRWYHVAYRLVPVAARSPLQVLADVAGRFRDARRVLNVVTDHYLFPYRDLWFPRQAS